MSLREAQATFADPFRTPVSALVHAVEHDTDGATPETAVRQGSKRLTRLVSGALDDVTSAMVQTLGTRRAFIDFRHEGFRRVRALSDVRRLNLWEVDEVAQRLPPRYVAVGAALGLLAGSFGRGGALVSVPLVLSLATRAIGDYAVHYGFDPLEVTERRFVRDVLVAALTPVASVRSASVEHLLTAAALAARAWQRREGRVTGGVLFRMVESICRFGLSRRQKKALVHAGSIVVAAAYAWLLVGVMRAARSAYRQRFLSR
jgi:hypothetical protein